MENKCHTQKATRILFNPTSHTLHCDNNKKALPVYAYVRQLVATLEQERRPLLRTYADFVEQSIEGARVAAMDQVISQIQAKNAELQRLHAIYGAHLRQHQDEMDGMRERVAESGLANKLEHYQAMQEAEANWTRDLMIEHVAQKKKATSPKAKPKPVVELTEKQVKAIKEKTKTKMLDVQKYFKFGNKDECTSKARSKPFYQTKEDILKVIESNPDIKKLMPPKYKSFTKEELCKHLF